MTKETNATEVNQLVNQILHDIKAPIAAINTIIQDLPEVTEKKRVILKHALNNLNNIANDLLKLATFEHSSVSSAQEAEPIALLLTWLFQEKTSPTQNYRY